MPKPNPVTDSHRRKSLAKRASKAKDHALLIRAAAIELAEGLPSEKITLKEMTDLLNKPGNNSPRGGLLTPTTLKRILKRCGGSIDDIRWMIWHDELYNLTNRDHLEPDFAEDDPNFQGILHSMSDGSLMGQRNQNRSDKLVRKLNAEPKKSIMGLSYRLDRVIEDIWAYDDGLPDGYDPPHIESLISEYLHIHREQVRLRNAL